jgi:L-asparaginase
MAHQKPRIALLVTGGTIDTVGEGRLDLADYARHQRWLSPGELAASVPELADLVDLTVIAMPRYGVRSMQGADWLDLRDAAERAVAAGAQGIVVTQGSNYVEENAYFLYLASDPAVPVVLTAAMRPASGMVSDGAMNLVHAALVAASPDSAGHGALVVMNSEIHSARHAIKGDTHALEGFCSPRIGPLGMVLPDGTVEFWQARTRRPAAAFDLSGLAGRALPRVDIVASYYGGDAAFVEHAVSIGARGIVSAGFGAGRPGPGYMDALRSAARSGVAVVLAARGNGRVLATPDLAEAGLIAAGDLTPWKARILLQLALVSTGETAALRRIFANA